MRGAEPRLPMRTASARRVRPFLRERERPVRSTAVPGGLRARVPHWAFGPPEPARPVLGPSGADAARSGPLLLPQPVGESPPPPPVCAAAPTLNSECSAAAKC